MTTHTVPGRGTHEGDEWDCGPCRGGLLEAFRPAAEGPGEPPAAEGPPMPLQAVQHDATSRVVPHTDQPGGEWRAACVCGWSKTGFYVRDGMGEHVARRLAAKYAQHHLTDPGAEL